MYQVVAPCWCKSVSVFGVFLPGLATATGGVAALLISASFGEDTPATLADVGLMFASYKAGELPVHGGEKVGAANNEFAVRREGVSYLRYFWLDELPEREPAPV